MLCPASPRPGALAFPPGLGVHRLRAVGGSPKEGQGSGAVARWMLGVWVLASEVTKCPYPWVLAESLVIPSVAPRGLSLKPHPPLCHRCPALTLGLARLLFHDLVQLSVWFLLQPAFGQCHGGPDHGLEVAWSLRPWIPPIPHAGAQPCRLRMLVPAHKMTPSGTGHPVCTRPQNSMKREGQWTFHMHSSFSQQVSGCPLRARQWGLAVSQADQP